MLKKLNKWRKNRKRVKGMGPVFSESYALNLYKEVIERARKASEEGDANAPAVSEGVTREEFVRRYNMLRLIAYLIVLGSVFSLVFLAMSSTLMDFLLTSVTLPLFLLFYVKYAFTLWRARLVFSDWDNRHMPMRRSLVDYYQGIKSNWKELLLLKL